VAFPRPRAAEPPVRELGGPGGGGGCRTSRRAVCGPGPDAGKPRTQPTVDPTPPRPADALRPFAAACPARPGGGHASRDSGLAPLSSWRAGLEWRFAAGPGGPDGRGESA